MERRRAAFILSFRSSSFFSSHQTTSCLWSWFFPSFSPVHWPRNDDFLCQKIRILFLFFLSRVPFSVARNEDHREKKGKPSLSLSHHLSTAINVKIGISQSYVSHSSRRYSYQRFPIPPTRKGLTVWRGICSLLSKNIFLLPNRKTDSLLSVPSFENCFKATEPWLFLLYQELLLRLSKRQGYPNNRKK